MKGILAILTAGLVAFPAYTHTIGPWIIIGEDTNTISLMAEISFTNMDLCIGGNLDIQQFLFGLGFSEPLAAETTETFAFDVYLKMAVLFALPDFHVLAPIYIEFTDRSLALNFGYSWSAQEWGTGIFGALKIVF